MKNGQHVFCYFFKMEIRIVVPQWTAAKLPGRLCRLFSPSLLLSAVMLVFRQQMVLCVALSDLSQLQIHIGFYTETKQNIWKVEHL